MSQLFVKNRWQLAATLGKQTDPLGARNCHSSNISAHLVDGCMKSTQALVDEKGGCMEIVDCNLQPILVPGCQDHFRPSGNTHREAVRRAVEEPFGGQAAASLEQLRLNLNSSHHGLLNQTSFSTSSKRFSASSITSSVSASPV